MAQTARKRTATKPVATDEAAKVASQAQGQLAEVAGTAKDQAAQVADAASSQARAVVSQATDQLTAQARDQQQQLSARVNDAARELRRMAASADSDAAAGVIVSELATQGGRLGDYLEAREPDQVLADLQDYARRRPGVFLVGAALAGVVVGRLGKAVKNAEDTSR